MSLLQISMLVKRAGIDKLHVFSNMATHLRNILNNGANIKINSSQFA